MRFGMPTTRNCPTAKTPISETAGEKQLNSALENADTSSPLGYLVASALLLRARNYLAGRRKACLRRNF